MIVAPPIFLWRSFNHQPDLAPETIKTDLPELKVIEASYETNKAYQVCRRELDFNTNYNSHQSDLIKNKKLSDYSDETTAITSWKKDLVKRIENTDVDFDAEIVQGSDDLYGPEKERRGSRDTRNMISRSSKDFKKFYSNTEGSIDCVLRNSVRPPHDEVSMTCSRLSTVGHSGENLCLGTDFMRDASWVSEKSNNSCNSSSNLPANCGAFGVRLKSRRLPKKSPGLAKNDLRKDGSRKDWLVPNRVLVQPSMRNISKSVRQMSVKVSGRSCRSTVRRYSILKLGNFQGSKPRFVLKAGAKIRVHKTREEEWYNGFSSVLLLHLTELYL